VLLGCDRITDASVRALATLGPVLNVLNIWGAPIQTAKIDLTIQSSRDRVSQCDRCISTGSELLRKPQRAESEILSSHFGTRV
jgi:hypothetical protein